MAQFFGLVLDDTGITEDRYCRYYACITRSPGLKKTEEMGVKIIGGQQYAVFSYTGSYEGLDEVYKFIYEIWLDESGHLPADSAIIEKYLNNPDQTPSSELITEIYFPI